MSNQLNIICRKYEDNPCYMNDFSVGKKAEKARSGNTEDILRLLNLLQVKYSDQTEDIKKLQEYLASNAVPKSETISEPDPTHNPVSEAVEGLIEINDTSSQERQYHPGMTYEINPDENVEIHSATNIMPMMLKSEFFGLVESIKAEGQQVPILTKDGEVVDGRNRLNACRQLGIPAKAQEVPEDTDIPKLVVILNEHRRHLSTSRKAASAVLYMEVTKVSGGRSREIVGNIFEVGGSSVQKAKKIKDTNEELFFKLHRGEISLQAAMKEIRKDDQPKTENDPAYSDDDACAELSKFFPQDKVDELSDLADKCSGKLKLILKTLLKHISGEITDQKIVAMVSNNSDSTSSCELEVKNECA